MGFLDWLKSKLGGGQPAASPPTWNRLQPPGQRQGSIANEPLVARFPGRPDKCAYCGAAIKSSQAQQCFRCGVDWHDPSNIIRRGAIAQTPLSTIIAQVAGEIVNNQFGSGQIVAQASGQQLSASAPPLPESRPLAYLELGELAPLTNSEVKQQARKLGNAWGNPWFGRRDLIPPLTDKRTELIDLGMLGQGLITAEELTEIHRVGAQMDELRPQLALAEEIAKSAVQQSEQDRALLKAQKKAAAAEKRKQHAEGVKQRRATDIVYLGRGVSFGLADRRSNPERLNQLKLPLLSTPAELAAALGIAVPRLRWLAFHSEAATRTHYVEFTIPKKSGGVRRLSAPHKSLRRCQEWILAEILEKLTTHPAAHGFVIGRGTKSNALPHLGKRVVVNADLCDFFPTIEFPRVRGAFHALGYSPAVATILALLCTEAPRRTVELRGQKYHVAVGQRGLPQGACTSPALSNLVSRKLDQRLNGIAAKLGWTYTRYADDLTFSTGDGANDNVGYLLARLRHITQEEGFAVNEKKTRVQRQNARQSVTGVVVNKRPGAPRDLVRRVRAILHQAKKSGLAAQNRRNHPDFAAHLAGLIGYIALLNPQQAAKLREAWRELQPGVTAPRSEAGGTP